MILEAALLVALTALDVVQILGFRDLAGEIFGAKPPLDWGYLLVLVGANLLLVGSLALAGAVFVRASEGTRIRGVGRVAGWAALVANAWLFVSALAGAFLETRLPDQLWWVGAAVLLLGVFLWLYATMRIEQLSPGDELSYLRRSSTRSE